MNQARVRGCDAGQRVTTFVCELKNHKMHAYELQDCNILKIRVYGLEGLQKYPKSRVKFEKRLCPSAMMQPVVQHPVDDDRIPAEAEAGMILAPCEPSEIG